VEKIAGDLTPVSPRPLDRDGLVELPALVASAGEGVCWRFLEFFTANIRNKNTRMAYVRVIMQFLARYDRIITRRASGGGFACMRVAADHEAL
jgi:hypothetical protein